MSFWRKLLGLRTKQNGSLSSVDSNRGLWHVIFDAKPGYWQQDTKLSIDTALTHTTVYACATLIASDAAKLRLRLVERTADGIWVEVEANSPFWPVLRKPNAFQTRQQFIEHWMLVKLLHGNVYVLKQRDRRGIVTALYVLDPNRVQPLVAQDGSVYYQLQEDQLSRIPQGISAIPASEIIHDRMNCLFHPLVGISPLYTCNLPALQGLDIQKGASKFFRNGSRPGGILTAPAHIEDGTAARIKDYWERNYTGDNIGKVAVLGDGLKYEALAVNAVDSQLIEQLKITAEQVCSGFHVPPYKVQVGPQPTYQNAEMLNLEYYSECIQTHLDAIEGVLDEGLGLHEVTGKTLGTDFEIEGLLRMDTQAQVRAGAEAVKAGGMSPNEYRARWLNLPPTPGGDSPMLQQQNWSLEQLAKRDIIEDKPSVAAPSEPEVNEEPSAEEFDKEMEWAAKDYPPLVVRV